jgi:3'-phosphoadenosine 5'-phosphosulfate sulfotransferase (PAPS reductase)/FAD synthetase
LIQTAKDRELDNVDVLYSDTGWSAPWWQRRVEAAEAWAQSLGFRTSRTVSIGLEQLVRNKKGWPRQGIQFCTEQLKIAPALEWLDAFDPGKQAICLVGIRRAESANRKNFESFNPCSPGHGERMLWAPLVDCTDEQRDALIWRAGFIPLPHRSMECFPCINSNRNDLRVLGKDEARIAEIEAIENSLGDTAKGKPRTMFRPYRYMGATGIREIVRWAANDYGKFDPDDGTGGGAGCDSGYCGR